MDSKEQKQLHGYAVEETNSQSGDKQLVEQKPIEGTPFGALKHGKDWYLILGKYKLTKPLPNEEAVHNEVNDTSWERLLTIMYVVAEQVYNEKESIKKYQN